MVLRLRHLLRALGAVVFGSTLALQGPISNYGAGLTIILTRPFVVGDTIRIDSVIGIVEEIKLAYTLLSNEDGEQITVPNNQVIGKIIYNSAENLIVEQKLTISYDDDPDKVILIILNEINKNPEVVSDPDVQIGIENFADYGIELGVRYWIPTRAYFQLKYVINKSIYSALRAENISLPYPRQTVHIEQTS